MKTSMYILTIFSIQLNIKPNQRTHSMCNVLCECDPCM